MINFIKQYVNDIIWASLTTILEIACISGCLFGLTYLPHGLSWFSFTYLQCFVIISSYRLITYKYKMDISENITNSNTIETPMTPSFNTIYPDKGPEDATRPMKNVYSAEEVDALNYEQEFSVRE